MKRKETSYKSFVKKMLEVFSLSHSDTKESDFITKIDTIFFPDNYNMEKINLNQYLSLGKNEYSLNPVCLMIEMFADSNGLPVRNLSRKYLHQYITIQMKKDKPSLKDALYCFQKEGVPSEEIRSFTLLNRRLLQSEIIIKNDKTKIDHYYTIEGLKEHNNEFNRDDIILIKIKDCIMRGVPVLIGLEVYQGFASGTKGKLNNHKYKGSLKHNKSLGLYGFNVVGYNDNEQNLLIYSGWNKRFGDNGFFKLNYEVLLKDTREIWYINNIKDK